MNYSIVYYILIVIWPLGLMPIGLSTMTYHFTVICIGYIILAIDRTKINLYTVFLAFLVLALPLLISYPLKVLFGSHQPAAKDILEFYKFVAFIPLYYVFKTKLDVTTLTKLNKYVVLILLVLLIEKHLFHGFNIFAQTGFYDLTRFSAFFANPYDLGFYLTFILIFNFGVEKKIDALFFSVVLVLIIATLSRTAFILVIPFVVYCVVKWFAKFRLLNIVLAALALGALFRFVNLSYLINGLSALFTANSYAVLPSSIRLRFDQALVIYNDLTLSRFLYGNDFFHEAGKLIEIGYLVGFERYGLAGVLSLLILFASFFTIIVKTETISRPAKLFLIWCVSVGTITNNFHEQFKLFYILTIHLSMMTVRCKNSD